MMSWVNVRLRRLSVSAELPEPIAEGLRWLRTITRSRPKLLEPSARLVIADRLPRLHMEKRDTSEALAFLREVYDHGVAHCPPTPADYRLGDIEQRIAKHWWYHTIELPGGLVTPGLYDHRPLVPHYGLPRDLAGQRALDVATFDGFWAFELERRGAEVVASDIGTASSLDMPPAVRERLFAEGLDRVSGDGFRLAHEALESNVRRIERSVYDLDPDELGHFDFVHMADLLLHVADPLGALRAVRRVTSGRALIVDCFDPNVGPGLTRYRGGWSGGVWWGPSLDTLGQMILDAGFSKVELRLVYSLGTVKGHRGPQRASLLATA